MKKSTSSIMLSLALLAGSTGAHAANIASDDFSSGLTSGGSGWDNDWQFGSNGASSGTVAIDASTTPLDGNGDYTHITGSGANATQGMHREYTSALTDIGQEHTISFLFRVDALAAGTGDSSRGLVTQGGIQYGLGGETSWALYAHEGNFYYFDGDGAGDFAGARTDSGVAVTVGDLYSVVVTNRIGADTGGSPTTGGEWDLIVINLTTSATVLDLTDLEYRRTTAPETAVIGLGVAGATAILANETSFDQLSVDEPSGAPIAITEFEYDPVAETVTLTWNKTRATTYIASSSFDLADWGAELDDGLSDDNDENPDDVDHITVTFSLIGLEDAPRVYFRIQEG